MNDRMGTILVTAKFCAKFVSGSPFIAFSLEEWLSGMDSNHDKSLQRALCYHYTTGQTAIILVFLWRLCKAKIAVSHAPAISGRPFNDAQAEFFRRAGKGKDSFFGGHTEIRVVGDQDVAVHVNEIG